MLNRRRRRRRVVVVGEERALGWGSGEGHTTAEHSTQWICTGVAMWLLASIYKRRRRRREEEQTGVACKGLFEIIFLFIISLVLFFSLCEFFFPQGGEVGWLWGHLILPR
jgi:hypothetical protein